MTSEQKRIERLKKLNKEKALKNQEISLKVTSVLQEHKELRIEMRLYIQHQLLVLGVLITILTLFLELAATVESTTVRTCVFSFIIPCMSIFLLLIWLDLFFRQKRIGYYCAKLEKKINSYFQNSDEFNNNVLYWEHWLFEDITVVSGNKRISFHRFYFYTFVCIFFVLILISTAAGIFVYFIDLDGIKIIIDTANIEKNIGFFIGLIILIISLISYIFIFYSFTISYAEQYAYYNYKIQHLEDELSYEDMTSFFIKINAIKKDEGGRFTNFAYVTHEYDENIINATEIFLRLDKNNFSKNNDYYIIHMAINNYEALENRHPKVKNEIADLIKCIVIRPLFSILTFNAKCNKHPK